MPPGYLKLFPGLAAIAVAACSSIPYSPRPIDADATVAEFLARSPELDGLRQFARANGYSQQTWPPQQWDVGELTLLALYFHQDVRIARARAQVAHAELVSAVQPQPWSARVKPEHHSRTLPEENGPWSLGLELEIPLVAQGKRAAQAERGTFLADAADLDLAHTVWLTRSRVRDQYLELRGSREALASLDTQLAARQEMIGLVNRRVEAGMLSAPDLAAERVASTQIEQARNQELMREQRAVAALAGALGLPMEVLDRMPLRFDAAAPPSMDMNTAALRSMALRNRLDVHRKLLEFGAADAEVKAAVAAQNPDITLGPGYMWDQGDNIWSLAVGMSLPPAARARAMIREAHARRELAAEQFAAVQVQAIGMAASAGAQYRLARERAAAAGRQLQTQRAQELRLERQFAAGSADRMQRLAARIETITAEAAQQLALMAERQALAQLEDAVQRPLLGDSMLLPARVQAPPDMSTGVANQTRHQDRPQASRL
ncbi:MAG: TolC family protein [Burkholderiales bacterium]